MDLPARCGGYWNEMSPTQYWNKIKTGQILAFYFCEQHTRPYDNEGVYIPVSKELNSLPVPERCINADEDHKDCLWDFLGYGCIVDSASGRQRLFNIKCKFNNLNEVVSWSNDLFPHSLGDSRDPLRDFTEVLPERSLIKSTGKR